MSGKCIVGNKGVALGYMLGVWQESRKVQISRECRFRSLFLEKSKLKMEHVKMVHVILGHVKLEQVKLGQVKLGQVKIG